MTEFIPPAKPREEHGPILEEGRRFTVEIEADWPDLEGRPLLAAHRKTFDVTARLLTGDERDEVYAKQVEVEPQFGDYQRKTERVIPVFELQRVGG